MKETKFKDFKGFEEKNTPAQFDQFEGQRLYGGKNRFVYDFSHVIHPFNNQSVAGDNIQSLVYGFPGNISRFFVNNPEGELNYTNLENWTDYEPTINPDDSTFFFNENALGYIDQADQDGFGFRTKANWAKMFRAGYVEFTIKTDKQNCIVASGSSEITVNDLATPFGVYGTVVGEAGVTATSLLMGDTVQQDNAKAYNYPYYHASSDDPALINLNIEIKNGKICVKYFDEYNKENVNFEFVGNESIADNQWHHIVVNFGRPGIVKDRGVKFNKKYVEIWVDGQLDKRFDDKVNEFNIFYPSVLWLFNSVVSSVENVVSELNLSSSTDTILTRDFTVGFDEILGNKQVFIAAVANTKNIENAFRGSIHTFAHGLNIPISKFEIQERYALWRNETKRLAKVVNLNAEMVSPNVSTSSKKALKLFWNNLIDNSKNGVELDNNFQVEAYSVTHKSKTSRTEIYSFATRQEKEINIFENVRVALKDNVLILGPEMVMTQNISDAIGNSAYANSPSNWNPKNINELDTAFNLVNYNIENGNLFRGPRADLSISGTKLNSGDRVLLTNQIRTEENGLWIYNGPDKYMTRPNDALSGDPEKINVVYVTDGLYKETYWRLESPVLNIQDPQKWYMVNTGLLENLDSDPILTERWKDDRGLDRFINLVDDLDISVYDTIVFMNYPETNTQIFENFPNESPSVVTKAYQNFLQSLKTVVANGASLFVSSPKLAEDLGIVKEFIQIEQEIESSDGRSAVVNPFQFNEPSERYFDTHRQNAYHLDTPVPGLTDKETWVLTEAINYLPADEYDYEQWHLKYSYRQFGLQEGNEFLIPSLPIRQVSTKDDLPGFRANARKSNKISVAAPNNVLAGTIVTSLANTHYHDADIATNEYDDYATTIIVHNGQQLGGTPIYGKIFVNCVEDAYTMSREIYNKATIQTVPENEPTENISTRSWQYSTSRLNRLPKRINVKELTVFGQTTATNGGGGPLVQAETNSSNGIIRPATDKDNKDYQSDLYPTEAEEIYPIQEIPVLSMTWLGLQWLAG
jgi:hypothetical protein